MLKYLFLIALMMFVPAISHATDPAMSSFSASTGAVNIPSLQVVGASAYYSVQMQQTPGFTFTVTNATSAATPTSSAYTASYNATTGEVKIPYLTVEGDVSGKYYSVTMQQQGQDLNFAVTKLNTNGLPSTFCVLFPTSSSYYVESLIGDPPALISSASISGANISGTVNYSYNLYPNRPGEWWTNPNIFISTGTAPVFPLNYITTIRYKDGTSRTVSATVSSCELAQ